MPTANSPPLKQLPQEPNGLKSRCRFEGKSWIPQVLISRTLSVYGEVAERLKAAVC
jgi:hypothetical protein